MTENGKLVVIIGLVLTIAVGIIYTRLANKNPELRMPHNGLFHNYLFLFHVQHGLKTENPFAGRFRGIIRY